VVVGGRHPLATTSMAISSGIPVCREENRRFIISAETTR